jgi:hypothetical protein
VEDLEDKRVGVDGPHVPAFDVDGLRLTVAGFGDGCARLRAKPRSGWNSDRNWRDRRRRIVVVETR